MSIVPSAAMFASMPLNIRKDGARAIQAIDFAVLGAAPRHRHAACDRQPVRVIGHGREPYPRSAQASAISPTVALPSLHSECICRSPP